MKERRKGEGGKEGGRDSRRGGMEEEEKTGRKERGERSEGCMSGRWELRNQI